MSNYEVGKQLAIKLADYKRLNPRLLTKKKISLNNSPFKNFQEIIELYDSYCPGIIDEMRGFIDETGSCFEKLAIFDIPRNRQSNCSQFVLLGNETTTGSTNIGRVTNTIIVMKI